jgi:hypothetical protein
MLRLVGCQCWGFETDYGHYLESCKLISILSKYQRFTILNLFFVFQFFFVHVASWFIGFLTILIKPKTLYVDFCVVEVGTTFFILALFTTVVILILYS